MKTNSSHRVDRTACVGYLRRSTDLQEQSLENQRRVIEAFARERGLRILDWYIDDAISGFDTAKRRGFQKLIEDAQRQPPSFALVLVYSVSRFGRVDPDEAGHFRFLLRQSGVEVVYVNENFKGDDADSLILGVKQWMGWKEIKDLSKVSIDGLLTLLKKGYWMGGMPPYGYDLGYRDAQGKPTVTLRFMEDGTKQVLDAAGNVTRVLQRGEKLITGERDYCVLVPSLPERVATVERIFREYLDGGKGLKLIAEGLNRSRKEGTVPTSPKGRLWASTTIHAIVSNPLYTGDTVWNRRAEGKFHRIGRRTDGQEAGAVVRLRHEASTVRDNAVEDHMVVHNTHPPLVSRELFERVTVLRAKRLAQRDALGGHNRGRPATYLLSGLVHCTCGYHFYGHTTTSGKGIKNYYYRCAGRQTAGKDVCVTYPLSMNQLDEFVRENVVATAKKITDLCDRGEIMPYLGAELDQTYGRRQSERERLRGLLKQKRDRTHVLMETITPENKETVKEGLNQLSREIKSIEGEIADLDRQEDATQDLRGLAERLVSVCREVNDLFQVGTKEEQQEFFKLFVKEVKLDPKNERGELWMWKIPGNSTTSAANGRGRTLRLVAGVRCAFY